MSEGFLILAQAGGGNPMGTLLFFGLMLAVFYFVLIRPQQKQLKEHRALMASLKKGDEVVTQGGMLGRIYTVAERTVTLEVANGVRVQVLKSSVQGRVQPTDTGGLEKKEEK